MTGYGKTLAQKFKNESLVLCKTALNLILNSTYNTVVALSVGKIRTFEVDNLRNAKLQKKGVLIFSSNSVTSASQKGLA